MLSAAAQMLYSHLHAFVVDDAIGTLVEMPEGRTKAQALGRLLGFDQNERKKLPKAIGELLDAGYLFEEGRRLVMGRDWVKRQGKRSAKGTPKVEPNSAESLVAGRTTPSSSSSLDTRAISTVLKREIEGLFATWSESAVVGSARGLQPTEADYRRIQTLLDHGYKFEDFRKALRGTETTASTRDRERGHATFGRIFENPDSVHKFMGRADEAERTTGRSGAVSREEPDGPF
jgi:hypothetical protein